MTIVIFPFVFIEVYFSYNGLPRQCTCGKEPTCKCRRCKRCGFDPLVGNIPWRMVTHSSILAWRIPWSEEPGGLHSPWCHKESDMTEVTQHTREVKENNCYQNNLNFLKTCITILKIFVRCLLVSHEVLVIMYTLNKQNRDLKCSIHCIFIFDQQFLQRSQQNSKDIH